MFSLLAASCRKWQHVTRIATRYSTQEPDGMFQFVAGAPCYVNQESESMQIFIIRSNAIIPGYGKASGVIIIVNTEWLTSWGLFHEGTKVKIYNLNVPPGALSVKITLMVICLL